MDSVSSSPEGDWAERKELEKNARYGMHIYFINQRPSWSSLELYTSQFHSGSTGLPQTDPTPRQALPPRSYELGSKARDKIRALTVSKTLALSDTILKLFLVSILRSPEWALNSLPTELANSQTAALKLFKKFTGPFSGMVI